jgi:sortase (surface protein transpeptidase)
MKNFLSKNWRRILIIIAAVFIIYNMYIKLLPHTKVLDAYRNSDINNEENNNQNKPIENNDNSKETENTKPEENNTNTNNENSTKPSDNNTSNDNQSNDNLPPKN